MLSRLICHHGQHARVVIGGYQVLGGHRISHESGYHSTATKLQINLNSVKRGLLKKGNTKTFKLQEKDGVSRDYEMVYRMASMESYMKGANYVGFVTSIASLAILPVMLLSEVDVAHHMSGLGSMSYWQLIGLWGFIVNHALAGYYLCYKVPLRIYHSHKHDNFLIVYHHVLPWRNSLVTVNDGDITSKLKYENKDIFYMNNYRHKYLSNDRVLYIAYSFFSSPFYYKKLLGINTEEFDD